MKYLFNQMVKYNRSRLDPVFSALADPTRRAILAHLANGEDTVTRLAKPFRMSLPAISKHLRILEAAGLLKRSKCGREHRMRISARPMRSALRWLERFQGFRPEPGEISGAASENFNESFELL